VIVIVVAQDREYAVRGRQWRERVGGWADEAPISPRHIVAAKNDEVRRLVHQQSHGAIDHLVRDRVAAMQVGDQSNA
jgi:hypothetical protein